MKPALLAAVLLIAGLTATPLLAANDANIDKFTTRIDNAAPDTHKSTTSRSEIKKCQQMKPEDRTAHCKKLLQGLGLK